MLAYHEAGEGSAVVLLHGFPLSRAIWDQQVAHLKEKCRVIIPDLPGMGLSTKFAEEEPVTMQRMAQEVVALLDHLKVDHFAVVGHSMGGYVALALQKLVPDRVAGLGLVSTQAGADSPEAREGRIAMAERVRKEGVLVVAEGMGPKLFGSDVTAESPVYKDVMSMMRLSSVDGVRGSLIAMAEREDHFPRLPEITCPTLIIAGEDDKIIPMDKAEVMAANLKSAVLTKVPGGHLPMLEQPAAVNEALERWVGLSF